MSVPCGVGWVRGLSALAAGHSSAEPKENEKTDTRQNLDKTVLEIEKMQIIFKNNFKKTIKQKS